MKIDEPKRNQELSKKSSENHYRWALYAVGGACCLAVIGLSVIGYNFLTKRVNEDIKDQLAARELAEQMAADEQWRAENEQWLAPNEPPARVASAQVIFPKFDASTVLHPLADGLYQGVTGKVAPDFNLTRTHEAYERLIKGEVDFIMVTSPSAEEQQLAEENGVKLGLTPIVSDAFVFLVASDNPVTNLTQEQVRGIYAGKITNWQQVGGQDAPIQAFQRPENSGSQTGMLDLVMRGEAMMKPTQTHRVALDMGSLVEAVMYNGESNGIGYSYKYYVDTIYGEVDANVVEGVKMLAIDGVAPTAENISTGAYPLTSKYYLVVNENNVSEQTRRVIELVQSAAGKKVIEELGYVAAD
jgi:phosphate transport system substrate-binding protein